MKQHKMKSSEHHISETWLILKHCQLIMALMLYSLTERAASFGLSLTQTSEPVVVRIAKIIFELALGVMVMKRLVDEIQQEFPQIHFPKLIHQPSE